MAGAKLLASCGGNKEFTLFAMSVRTNIQISCLSPFLYKLAKLRQKKYIFILFHFSVSVGRRCTPSSVVTNSIAGKLQGKLSKQETKRKKQKCLWCQSNTILPLTFLGPDRAAACGRVSMSVVSQNSICHLLTEPKDFTTSLAMQKITSLYVCFKFQSIDM